jgi:murein DD-endopeptidase MepM/ murein hydrolase activator NlpD
MPPGLRRPVSSGPRGTDPVETGYPARRRCWPLPDTEHALPSDGAPGSFWEDRGDRRHAGVDLYAPPGARVVAIEEGTVISAGVFTSPDLVPYWNTTYQVTIAHTSGIYCRYAELGDLTVEAGAGVSGGTCIGHVGTVLNLSLVTAGAPPYILALREYRRASMLHFEVLTSNPGAAPEYRGGNWFSQEKPAHLVDPALVLRDVA